MKTASALAFAMGRNNLPAVGSDAQWNFKALSRPVPRCDLWLFSLKVGSVGVNSILSLLGSWFTSQCLSLGESLDNLTLCHKCYSEQTH